MKKIRLIPTEKPSRLFKDGEKLKLDIESYGVNNQHIYITSDEEIKDEDYYIHTNQNFIIKIGKGEGKLMKGHLYLKKIILTTDPELIANSIQAIDDEFLEWFVKNPSCESIEVESYKIDKEWDEKHTQFNPIYPMKTKYIIIIPQEEPKQETLEEAAQRLYPISKEGSMWMPSADDCNKANKQEGFIAGAKWQAERMYSEEEVIELLTQRSKHFGTKRKPFQELLLKQDLEWFKQFKKK
jgi:hypothetical protein